MSNGTRTRSWLTAPVGVALLAAGCSSGSDYANTPRPPAPVAVSAAVADGRISVSPERVGAGPIRLTVANLTPKSLKVGVHAAATGGAGSAGARSGPINPLGTAQLQLQVSQGTYKVLASRGSIAGTTLQVGQERPSAQNQLLLP